MSKIIDDDGDEIVEKNNHTDLIKVASSIFGEINWKVAFLLLIMGIIIFSDVFVENVLASNFTGLVSNECPTSKGTMIQLVFLVISYIFSDLLVKYEFI